MTQPSDDSSLIYWVSGVAIVSSLISILGDLWLLICGAFKRGETLDSGKERQDQSVTIQTLAIAISELTQAARAQNKTLEELNRAFSERNEMTAITNQQNSTMLMIIEDRMTSVQEVGHKVDAIAHQLETITGTTIKV